MFTLAPKDPFRNGRAIVAEIVPSEFTNEDLFLVHTDFGHTMKLTAGELRELYEIDKPMSFEVWNAERAALVQQNEQVGPSVRSQQVDAALLLLEQRLVTIITQAGCLRIKNPIKAEIINDAQVARDLLGQIAKGL